jgi:hypothetical protein
MYFDVSVAPAHQNMHKPEHDRRTLDSRNLLRYAKAFRYAEEDAGMVL